MLNEVRKWKDMGLLSKKGISYRKDSVWIINHRLTKKKDNVRLFFGKEPVFLYRCRLAKF